jgi:hypothetical protein
MHPREIKSLLNERHCAMNHARISLAIAVAAALLIGPAGYADAAPAGLTHSDSLSAIELVQENKKPETIKHAAKRIWRNLTGYKFDVACPFSQTTCTENGKSREDARAKCQAQHMFCQIRDAR